MRMKILNMWLLLFVFCGCAVFRSLIETVPASTVYWDTVFSEYQEDVNDCSNKASRYCQAVLKEGLNADCIIIDILGGTEKHAVVRIAYSPDKIVYYDMITGRSSRNLSDFGVYYFTVPRYWLGNFKEWK